MKNYILKSFLLILILFSLVGCDSNQKSQSENKELKNNSTVNNNSASKANGYIDNTVISAGDNETETNDKFAVDEIKEFILNADTLADQTNDEYTSSQKIIGEYDNADVAEIQGEYDTFDKVKQLLGNYYTDEIIEMELVRRYLVNLYGVVGEICASGENSYNISDKSTIKILTDEDNKKIVEMEAYNDNGDTYKVEYTLEKINSNWIITNEKGYLNEDIKDIEKHLYYGDFLITASSSLDNYPPENAMDDNPKTAWVEGVDGNGFGEQLEFKANDSREVTGIKMINGYAKSEDLYYKNNRVKKIRIELSDNTIIEKEFEDGFLDYQNIEFGKVVVVNEIKITISDIYQGSKYNDTCISEMKVYR